ncbi:MAG: hypothetical protein H3C52_06015 [Anaerolineales bacterium]|jgi:8-oxo-dGTP diphosphatase|nr:hypothetical protein [Anaerolineales bacterium]MCZ2289360.1 hypothetical protein [Anaerolineales bacterium]
MLLATLCYLHHNNHTLMLHRVKKENDIHAGKFFSAKFIYEGDEMKGYDAAFY